MNHAVIPTELAELVRKQHVGRVPGGNVDDLSLSPLARPRAMSRAGALVPDRGRVLPATCCASFVIHNSRLWSAVDAAAQQARMPLFEGARRKTKPDDLRYMYTIYKISTKLYTKSIYKRRLSAYVHITWTRHST